MRNSFLFTVTIAAAIAASGCLTAPKSFAADGAAQNGMPLGTDLAGEACQGVARSGPSPAPGQPPALDIFCGASAEAGGNLWADALPSDIRSAQGKERQAAIENAAKETVEGQSIAQRMSCGTGSWLGGDTVFYACTLRASGWPQIVVVTATDTALYQIEALPALWPALPTAIAHQSGKTPDLGAGDAAKIVTASFKDDLARIGNVDFASFNQFMRLGRLYNDAHNFAASENAYRSALEIETRAFGPNSEGVGAILMELALQVSDQGRFDEAASLFRRADPIQQRSPKDALHARYFAYLALDAANQDKYEEALAYARQAIALRRGLTAPADSAAAGAAEADQNTAALGELTHALRIEAAMELRLGEVDDAEASITEALETMSQVQDLPLSWRIEGLSLLGEIDAANGRDQSAKRALTGAVALGRRLFGSTAPTAQALLSLGRFEAQRQQDDEAVATYRAAFDIVAKDQIERAELMPDQITPFFESATALATQHPEQRDALAYDMFRASQFVNSGVAGQTIARASARLATDDPAIRDLIRQTQEAERARDQARLALANEQVKPGDERGRLIETALAENVEAANAKADEFNHKLQSAFPAYAGLAAPDVGSIAQVQQSIGTDEAVLTFVIGRTQSYAMVLRRDNFVVRPIEIADAALAQSVAKLRGSMEPRLGGLPEYDTAAAYDLYRKIVAPVEPGLAGVDHLIVVPDQSLSSLPFALLVTAAPAHGAEHAYGNAAWIIRRMAVSEAPSVRGFLDLRNARQHATLAAYPFLGVGNPNFAGAAKGQRDANSALGKLATTCRQGGPMPADQIRALQPLPETAGEVRRVAERLGADPATVLLGDAATEANLRNHKLQDYNVLYFATHGLLPGELNCESEPGLALSPPRGQAVSADDDGLLEASEIAGLTLNANLVVLSACNTAAAGGGQFGGEALSGLAEAFFYAGARTLIASHWQVPSQATSVLMTGLFDRLGPRLSGGIAESLRQAQLAVLSTPATSHPFYWAAFSVIGDGGAGSVAPQAQIQNPPSAQAQQGQALLSQTPRIGVE